MRTSELSVPRRRLVDVMTAIDYGIIEDLEVRAGEPQLGQPIVALRDIRLGTPLRCRAQGREFELRSEVLELFALFDREQNLKIARLTVQAGLPLRLKVRTTVNSQNGRNICRTSAGRMRRRPSWAAPSGASA